jgi:hypothetical protein
MKKISLIILFIIFVVPLAGCKPQPRGADMPTPVVPSIDEVTAAINLWEKTDNKNYFSKINESTSSGYRQIRLVIHDSEIRAAQSLEKISTTEFGSPVAMPLNEAQEYTIDAIFSRIHSDTLSEGQVPVNLNVVFNPDMGYPSLVHAEAQSTFTEEGLLSLNREYNYSYTISVDPLLEDIYGVSRQTLLNITRSGGQHALCDNLRIFSDGSSIYADDCNETLLQQRPPLEKFDALLEWTESFSRYDGVREDTEQTFHLVVSGNGSQEPPENGTGAGIWELAIDLIDLLSQPIGSGMTALFINQNEIFGLDMRRLTIQPASIQYTGELLGATLSSDGTKLIFSDEKGVQYIDTANGEIALLLHANQGENYNPRDVNDAGNLVLSRIIDQDEQIGWISTVDEQIVWNTLPLTLEGQSYGCEVGLSFAPSSGSLALTERSSEHQCSRNPGITVIDLEDHTAEMVYPPQPVSGSELIISEGALTPAWSPDGLWIAFSNENNSSSTSNYTTQLNLIRPDGTELTTVSNNVQEGIASHPVWTPDSKILYYGLTGSNVEEDGIHFYDMVTGKHDMLTDGQGLHPVSVSPDGAYLVYNQSNGSLMIYSFLSDEIIPVAVSVDGEQIRFVGWLNARDE